ncbi:MAG: transposase [candidate division KSB1 bacterium]|nr:transposase [candidate division KSB1 bacterium]MDZ7304780.1 transposase [candidate division KSB1 bacterium]MDZ7313874.1 transposase [candidate division KSB1 bacterium]
MQVKVYEGVAYRDCPLRSQCTRRQAQNRRLTRWVHEAVIEAMQQRVWQHPEKIKQRKQLVEHPFGTIKHWMNHGYFLMRGLEKVGAEMSLSVLAYNLMRVISILGVEELLKAIAKGMHFSFFPFELHKNIKELNNHNIIVTIKTHKTKYLSLQLDCLCSP